MRRPTDGNQRQFSFNQLTPATLNTPKYPARSPVFIRLQEVDRQTLNRHQADTKQTLSRYFNETLLTIVCRNDLDISPSFHALSVNKPVVLGSSTGGTQALELVLTELPADGPGIAIVQHMPERFSVMYAARLDGLCAMNIREAKSGDRIERGVALIAPGGKHLKVRKQGGQYYAEVFGGPPVNRHCPAVDVLFKSMAECAGPDALGIIMTGMGDDGARGLLAMRQAGAHTIAQDEASCVVFGMPKEAIRMGATETVVPLERLAGEILRFDRRG
jgi:two-component system chemotaxis response regulator CheB